MKTPSLPARLAWRLAAAVLLGAAVLVAVSLGRAPRWVAIGYLGIGVVSIALYWADKAAAERGAWRISEATLHAIDFAGGIIGGLLAQAPVLHLVALGALDLGFVDTPDWMESQSSETIVSDQLGEERAHIGGEQVGDIDGGKVTAARHLRPVHDIVVRLAEGAHRTKVVGEHCDAGRHVVAPAVVAPV
jgi:uncharacterized membrane protein YsdA (DUF1294 family)